MRRMVTRYYIAKPDANIEGGEKFWNGTIFTRYIDECKVYISKPAAQKCLVKLVKSGYGGIELKESRYLL